MILSLCLFWDAPDFLGAYHVLYFAFLSLSGLFNSGFFVTGASKTHGFWFLNRFLLAKIEICKENRGKKFVNSTTKQILLKLPK